MATLTSQTGTVYSLDTVFGKDLRFRAFSGQEALSAGFEYAVEAVSLRPDLDPAKILGELANVAVELPAGGERHFNGHVAEFLYEGQRENSRFHHYRLVLRPWTWLLSRNSDCRLFQAESIPDIIKKVFTNYGDAQFKLSLTGSYEPREYCVQYRETDLNFVMRLMEQEGITFFFTHEADKHTLTLVDSPSAHKPFAGFETLQFNPSHQGGVDGEAVSSWQFAQRIEPASYTLRDFNFKRPSDDLHSVHRQQFKHAASGGEMYDYPGEYETGGDGKRYARARLEELQAGHEIVQGSANVRGIVTGCEFKIKDHPRSDQNGQDWLVTGTQIHGEDDTGDASEGAAGLSFHCSFQAMPARRPFRPARVTPRPIVQGPQTAFVVGPPGDEIHVDEHGRIKVHFHWDRLGDGKDKDSCWIRVAQIWAGNAYGALSLPRIGQEVIVEFLEGDPDRPLVTGSLYNGTNRTPFSLPAEKTRWGFKSRSTKGGGASNFNEFSFEDSKGKEEVYLHAEKDQTLFSKNNRTEYIGGESHLQVTKDTKAKHGANVHTDITGDDVNKVGGNYHLAVSQNWEVKTGPKFAVQAGNEIHLKSGTTVIIESGTQISLKVGGNFIDINSGGVFIKGSMVMVNSGGAAGSGSGASPGSPDAADKARDSKGGTDKAIQVKKAEARKASPKAAALKSARAKSAPFCEICEG